MAGRLALVVDRQSATEGIESPVIPEEPAKLGGDGTLEVLAPDGNGALSVTVDSEALGLLRERMAEKEELIALTGC